MTPEKLKLLHQLTEIEDVIIVKKFNNPINAFAYYFSKLDINGVDSILSNQNNYDGITKLEYLNLIKEHFISLKNNEIFTLKAYSGVCNGCKNGCSGFTFLDESKGFFTDFIIEVKDSEILNFMEYFNMVNEVNGLNKKERLTVKPFKLDSDNFYVPF